MKKINSDFIEKVILLVLILPVLLYALKNNRMSTFFDLLLYFSYVCFASSITIKLSNWISKKHKQ